MEKRRSVTDATDKEIEELNPWWDEKSEYPLPPETRKSLIIKCVIAKKGIKRISFLPVFLTVGSEPETLKSGDERFENVVQYIDRITGEQGISTRFVHIGDEVVIETD